MRFTKNHLFLLIVLLLLSACMTGENYQIEVKSLNPGWQKSASAVHYGYRYLIKSSEGFENTLSNVNLIVRHIPLHELIELKTEMESRYDILVENIIVGTRYTIRNGINKDKQVSRYVFLEILIFYKSNTNPDIDMNLKDILEYYIDQYKPQSE